jgi:hypothetical protein
MPYGNVNVDTVTTSTVGGILGAGNASIMKNRLINGACVIDQRNAGASVTLGAGTTITLDRWSTYSALASKISIQQNAGSVTPPVGFSNYLGVTSLAATTPASEDIYVVRQYIEGYNVADLNWGSANAKTITLSFWIRSSVTGTYGGALKNGAGDYSYPFTYSITAANTWEQKSITVAGSTNGTWLTTNGLGLSLVFSLGSGAFYAGTAGSWTNNSYFTATGSTNLVATNGATWYMTGAQIEEGSSATGFEYVNNKTSLANCQRYAVVLTSVGANEGIGGLGIAYANNNSIQYVPLPVTPRTNSPSISYTGSWVIGDGITGYAVTNISSGGGAINSASVNFTVASGLTQFRPYYAYTNGSNQKIIISMEL